LCHWVCHTHWAGIGASTASNPQLAATGRSGAAGNSQPLWSWPRRRPLAPTWPLAAACWSLLTGLSSLGSARLASTSRRSMVCCTLITCGGKSARGRSRAAVGEPTAAALPSTLFSLQSCTTSQPDSPMHAQARLHVRQFRCEYSGFRQAKSVRTLSAMIGSAKTTNPKPRGRPVCLSYDTNASWTVP